MRFDRDQINKDITALRRLNGARNAYGLLGTAPDTADIRILREVFTKYVLDDTLPPPQLADVLRLRKAIVEAKAVSLQAIEKGNPDVITSGSSKNPVPLYDLGGSLSSYQQLRQGWVFGLTTFMPESGNSIDLELNSSGKFTVQATTPSWEYHSGSKRLRELNRREVRIATFATREFLAKAKGI